MAASKCHKCQQVTSELFTPTLLKNEWILVPAASGAKYPYCKPCAERVLLSKELAKLEANQSC